MASSSPFYLTHFTMPAQPSKSTRIVLHLPLTPSEQEQKSSVPRAETCQTNKQVPANHLIFSRNTSFPLPTWAGSYRQIYPLQSSCVIPFILDVFFNVHISESRLNFLLIRNNLYNYLPAFTPCNLSLVVRISWGPPASANILCQHQPFHTSRSPVNYMDSCKMHSSQIIISLIFIRGPERRVHSLLFFLQCLYLPFFILPSKILKLLHVF